MLISERVCVFFKESLDNNKSFKFDAIFESKNGECGSKLNMMRIDKLNSSRLVAACKRRGVRFSGFFMACIFYTIRDLYVENGLEAPRDVFTCISVNMRFRLRPQVDFSSPGYFSGLIPIQTEYPQFGRYEDIWSDSKYWDELIRSHTDMSTGALFVEICDDEGHQQVDEMFEKAKNLYEVCGKLQSHSRQDVFMSNIGRYLCNSKRQDPPGPYKLAEIYYADSLSARPAINNALIYHSGLWNDELMFMISSDRTRLAAEHTDRLVDLLERLLNRLAQEESNSN